MLFSSIITVFILITPFIIPLAIIGIVKMCSNKTDKTNNSYYNNPPYDYNGYYQPYNNSYTAPKTVKVNKKHDMTVSNILFLIGTAFIVLSGIAFGVAKWVHTSHEGRVAIIIAASAVSFILSAVVGKFLKLNGTSISFYVLGSGFIATALLTAGFYKLLGEWLSFGGNGIFALLSLSSGISALMLFAGNKIFKKLPLIYTALSASALTLLFAVNQISTDLMITAPIFLTLQIIITGAIYGTDFLKEKRNELPIKIVGCCASYIYGCFPIIYILRDLRTPTFVSYLLLAAIIIQLLFYAKKTKESVFVSIASMTEILLAYMTSISITQASVTRYGILAFGLFAIIIYVLHRFVSFLKNAYTECITLLTAVIGGLICIFSAGKDGFIPEMILASAVSILIASYIFHKNENIQCISSFASPIIPALITEMAGRCAVKTYGIVDKSSFGITVWCIFAAILIISVLLIVYLPKYAFSFHAKHPRNNNIVIYVNLTLSGIILTLLPAARALVILPSLMCFIHFAVSNKARCNFPSVISAIALLHCIYAALDERQANTLMTSVILISVLCIYMLLSKLIYNNGIIVKSNERIIIDPMLLSGWLAIVMMYQDASRTAAFFMLIGTGIYCASFIKKNTSHETAAILLTVTSSLTALALMFRPFLIPGSKAVSFKITVAIIALVGLACRYIWREYANASKISSNSIFITAFIALLIDAMYFDTALNTIFVMSVMLFVLIISIIARSKTWFIASSASLFTITVYATREYLMALNWWIYLFLAGITLIALAAWNEYCKKNDQTLKSSVAKRFSGWTW